MGKYLEVPGADYSAIAIGKVTPVVGKVDINVVASPTEGGTTTGTGSYDEGAQVQISATPAVGFIFDKWNDNNTSASRSVLVGSTPATYTAFFNINLTYKIETAAQLVRFEAFRDNPFKVGKTYRVTLSFSSQISHTSATTNTYFKMATTDSSKQGATAVETIRRWCKPTSVSAPEDVAGEPELTNVVEFTCTKQASFFVVYTSDLTTDVPNNIVVSAVEI